MLICLLVFSKKIHKRKLWCCWKMQFLALHGFCFWTRGKGFFFVAIELQDSLFRVVFRRYWCFILIYAIQLDIWTEKWYNHFCLSMVWLVLACLNLVIIIAEMHQYSDGSVGVNINWKWNINHCDSKKHLFRKTVVFTRSMFQ